MLTARQRRFVEEYLLLGNAAQAALRAGYTANSPRQTANRVMKHPEVAEAIRAGIAARSERTRITADRVLLELARIAFADIGRLADWGPQGLTLKPKEEVSEADRAAILALTKGKGEDAAARLFLHNKLKALDSLARHLSLYGRTAGRFAPPPRAPGEKSAREILMERLAKLAGDTRGNGKE
jgi:phage terminase small subunit